MKGRCEKVSGNEVRKLLEELAAIEKNAVSAFCRNEGLDENNHAHYARAMMALSRYERQLTPEEQVLANQILNERPMKHEKYRFDYSTGKCYSLNYDEASLYNLWDTIKESAGAVKEWIKSIGHSALDHASKSPIPLDTVAAASEANRAAAALKANSLNSEHEGESGWVQIDPDWAFNNPGRFYSAYQDFLKTGKWPEDYKTRY